MTGSGAERVLVAGRAEGAAVRLDEPLSFWGGFDSGTGEIIDQHHPQRGTLLTGRIVVMPAGRGSSSSSSGLAEAIRAGTAPAAIVLEEPDAIIAIGAVVAGELYGRVCAVVVDPVAAEGIRTGDSVRVAEDGAISVG